VQNQLPGPSDAKSVKLVLMLDEQFRSAAEEFLAGDDLVRVLPGLFRSPFFRSRPVVAVGWQPAGRPI